MPNFDLANRDGLWPSACFRQVQELARRGTIVACRAVQDPTALGLGFVACVSVNLNTHTTVSLEAFEQAVVKAPEVFACHYITGSAEFLLRVEAADLAAYCIFNTELLGTLPQVHSLTTFG